MKRFTIVTFCKEVQHYFCYLYFETETEFIDFIFSSDSKPAPTSLRSRPPTLLLGPTPLLFILKKDIIIEIWYLHTI